METSDIAMVFGATMLGFVLTAAGVPFSYLVLCCAFAVLGFYAGYNY
jgi:hypothetical protein